jgi:hypothetical protein
VIVIVGTTVALTVTVIPADVAVVGDAQDDDDVNTQVTTEPLVRLELMNVLLLVPTLVVPTFHWNEGLVPPLVICAVNVSGAPLHTDVLVACITIVGICVPTVIVIAFDVAVVGDAQPELDVITQVTTCPLVSVAVLYVGLLVPTLVVPTFH